MRRFLRLLLCLPLVACHGGSYDSGSNAATSPGGPPDASFSSANCAEFLVARVQPRLGYCRSCHVPGGVGDVPDGDDFQLSSNPADDLARLRASWTAVGVSGGVSRILTMAANNDPRAHTGGAAWPEGSDAYTDMARLLAGFDDPSACVTSGLPTVAPEAAADLLPGPRGAHVWHEFCADAPDSAALPLDPRTLVVEGANADKNVVFNAYWKQCPNPIEPPSTCGELRGHVAQGFLVGEGQGEAGSPTMFGRDYTETADSSYLFPATIYQDLWRQWELDSRPADFDKLAAERYGSPLTPFRNPYPLAGEDPNATDGGSGQLPLALTQTRRADGSWTGNIGIKLCVLCHNGQLGHDADGYDLGPEYGGAGSIGDFAVLFADLSRAGATAYRSFDGVTIATQRGTGAIDQFQLGFLLFTGGDPTAVINPRILNSQAIGTIKSPPWWNLGFRPQKFHGAVLPTDASRIDLAAYYPITDDQRPDRRGEPVAWVDENAVPFQLWAESLPPPAWPFPVDRDLAATGAILFHNKDLWDPALNNPVPEPDGGNGSCASCHGVYAPRFANDPAWLDDPRLAGIAARILPMAVIRTDPVYAEALQTLKEPDGSTNAQINNNPFLYCGLGAAGEEQTPSLLAPPLSGIWAAAPYLHNGSVPNIWMLLDPATPRPRIWKRVSTPLPEALAGTSFVMGFDTDLDRAYDPAVLGWRFEEVDCGAPGTQDQVDCNSIDPTQRPLAEAIVSQFYGQFALLWNAPRPGNVNMTNQQVENRKIYNTNLYSQGNQGHDFTSVLTHRERLAILEYLKTL